jgi:N-acetylglutamate synthase-like GNAT family acetyltransferase
MNIRKATLEDLNDIINLLADDQLGEKRELLTPLPQKEYVSAFKSIDADKNQDLVVLEEDSRIIGTLQLTFIQHLTYRGGVRAQIEAVRIRKDKRGQGAGRLLFLWAIKKAEYKNAHLVQLTTDKQRPDAIQFYQKLGFKPSHEGMKLHFPDRKS